MRDYILGHPMPLPKIGLGRPVTFRHNKVLVGWVVPHPGYKNLYMGYVVVNHEAKPLERPSGSFSFPHVNVPIPFKTVHEAAAAVLNHWTEEEAE